MAFELKSKISIGEYSFTGGVHDLSIKKSIHCIVDTGKLTIPGIGKVINKGSLPQDSVQTGFLFKEGDRVSIDLGYNTGHTNDLKNEFRGFVRRVNLSTPLIIDLEGYAWQLRYKTPINKYWKNIDIKEVLYEIIKDTDIVLSPDIPAIPLSTFSSPNLSRIDLLDLLKQKMLLTVYFDDNVLYVGIQEGRTTLNKSGFKVLSGLAEVNYSIGYNTIKSDDLKLKLATDNNVCVKIRVKSKDGKSTFYERGDKSGSLREKIIPFISDTKALNDLATTHLGQIKYDGYEGKIVAFLQPFCKPGWKATIKDKKFDGARAGSYFIHTTEVTFGAKGARRNVSISYRLDKLLLS